jgi:UPF0042 nucleotide-binding protein
MAVPKPSRLRLHRRDTTPAGPASPLEDLVLITGFSGAGKSTAMAVFEDHGYFCVDNLPPGMIASLAELFTHEGSKIERAAVVCDARGGEHFGGLSAVLDELDAAGTPYRLLLLEADPETLLTRFKETRRRHPLAVAGSVEGAIAAERELLAPLRERADRIIRTDGLSAAKLRRQIADDLLRTKHTGRLAVTFQSFGFKHGPARDADLLFDCRFLPNPHYEAHLRPLTGHDPRVVAYANQNGGLDEFCERVGDLLDYLFPQYVAEGKAHLVVAIGCTGGRHRSVAIADCLGARFLEHQELATVVEHRDVDRPQRGA